MSRSIKALIEAYEIGYRIVNGKLKNPKGQIINGVLHQCYYRFSYKFDNTTTPILFHRLVAYQKYGNRLFEKNLLVRHKDGNSLNNKSNNILLGTQSQNMMDRKPKQRIEHAIHAASSLRKFSDETVKQIKNDRKNGFTYKQLCEKYKTIKSTLSYLFNKSCY